MKRLGSLGHLYNILTSVGFPVEEFDGTKQFVLATTSSIGGRNMFLAFAYIVVGLLCLTLGIVFLLRNSFSPRFARIRYFGFVLSFQLYIMLANTPPPPFYFFVFLTQCFTSCFFLFFFSLILPMLFKNVASCIFPYSCC